MSNTLLTGLESSSMTPVYLRASRMFIAQSNVAVIAPAAGVMGDNGALSGLPASLPKAYTNAWIFLQAGKLYAGSLAGIYFIRMSSFTTGTVYAITLPVGVAPYVPSIADLVRSRIVATGPGAFTGNVATDVFISIKVPGKVLGGNGVLNIKAAYSANGAGNPAVGVSFGPIGQYVTNEFHKLSLGTSQQANYDVSYRNQGLEDTQYTSSVAVQDGSGATAGPALYPEINTAVDQWVNFGLHIGSVAGGAQLEGFTIEAICAP